MNEAVIVLADLYLDPETPLELPEELPLPGLSLLARFATRERLTAGWRDWVARWTWRGGVGSGSTDARAPAMAPATVPAPATVAASAVWHDRHRWIGAEAPSPAAVWLATPVHLLAGLASAHLDRRGILRLSPEEQARLAEDFRQSFAGTPFGLIPLPAGGFLLTGPGLSTEPALPTAPEPPLEGSPEPARCVGVNLARNLILRSGVPALRQLGAEIEMWLHAQALNTQRQHQGLPPLTALWLWGGGPAPQRTATDASRIPDSTVAFGRDPFVDGLWGSETPPLPPQAAEIFGYAGAERVLVVEEVGRMLHSNPKWLLPEALAECDRTLLVPALQRLRAGELVSLSVLANDRRLTLRRADLQKFWRRRLRAAAAFV